MLLLPELSCLCRTQKLTLVSEFIKSDCDAYTGNRFVESEDYCS